MRWQGSTLLTTALFLSLIPATPALQVVDNTKYGVFDYEKHIREMVSKFPDNTVKKVQIYDGWLYENTNNCGWYEFGGVIKLDISYKCSFEEDLEHELLHDYFFNNPQYCNHDIECEHIYIRNIQEMKSQGWSYETFT